jgi:hypothetical protein
MNRGSEGAAQLSGNPGLKSATPIGVGMASIIFHFQEN